MGSSSIQITPRSTQEARKRIESLIGKIQKSLLKLSSHTDRCHDLEKDLQALETALKIITDFDASRHNYSISELCETRRSLLSIVEKSQTAKRLISQGTPQDSLLNNRINALMHALMAIEHMLTRMGA